MSATITVRMYNQNNLGDCFLLKFTDGASESFLLIDFGSYVSGNDKREIEIAEDIKQTVKDKPLTIVLTHQHKDHLTGFISSENIMKDLNISEIWFSYLDDPKGKEAKVMRDATKKFWEKNGEIKKTAKKKFKGVAEVEKMLNAKEKFDLFAEEQTGGMAITNLLRWSQNQCRFLVPGKNFDVPGLPDNSVKVYVLGPPTDPVLLKKLNPSKGDAVHSLDSMLQLSSLGTSINLVGDALDTITPGINPAKQSYDFPFNKKFTYAYNSKQINAPKNKPASPRSEIVESMRELSNTYVNAQKTWRRIDHDWLSEFGRVSLHMDSLTNNSSLVLAFEIVKTKKVLLFVGDAQIGNWKSWSNVKFEKSSVKANELLSRTVVYKAGHHSSHNATLLEGLDLMDENELVILIPVNQKVSDKMGFSMLKPGMMAGYNRKSNGRVLRSDTIFHKPGRTNKFLFPFKKAEKDFEPKIKVVKDKAKKSHLYIEYTVK